MDEKDVNATNNIRMIDLAASFLFGDWEKSQH